MAEITLMNTFTIGSFNIRYDEPRDGEHRWEKRIARFFELLHHWNPDILGLQEVRRGPYAQIHQTLTAYSSVGVGRDDGREAGEFCPIFYRHSRFSLAGSGTFWFSETPEEPGSSHWGNRNTRICTWAHLKERDNGTEFSVYNLHLDHESQPSREKSVHLLLKRIWERSANVPVVVMGDFNAEPDNPAILSMTAPGSPTPHSALAAFPDETAGTFHGFTGETIGGRIDHIFLSPEWEVLKVEIMQGDGSRPFPSDHFPISATLSLR